MELPEGKKVLIFCFNVLLKGGGNGTAASARSIDDAVEDMRPLMLLVFYFIDKVGEPLCNFIQRNYTVTLSIALKILLRASFQVPFGWLAELQLPFEKRREAVY